MSNQEKPILSIKNLHVSFKSHGKDLKVIRGITLDIKRGETFAIVGESGSGKSVFTKTFTGMLEKNGKIKSGSVILHDVKIADPQTVKQNFNDEDRFKKICAKMYHRSAKGLIEAKQRKIVKNYEREKAHIEQLETQMGSSVVFANYRKKVDEKYASRFERLAMKKAFKMNKLYDRSSKIQVKRQKATDKIIHRLNSAFYKVDKLFAVKEMADLQETWTTFDPTFAKTRQSLKDEIEKGILQISASDYSRKSIMTVLSSAKVLKRRSVRHLKRGLKAVLEKTAVLDGASSGLRLIDSNLYAELLEDITFDVEGYYRILKQINKHDIAKERDFYDREIKKLNDCKEEEYALLKVKAEEDATANRSIDFDSMKTVLEETTSSAKKAIADTVCNSLAATIETTKQYLDDGSVLFTAEEKENLIGYRLKDLKLLAYRHKKIKELENKRDEISRELASIQSDIIAELEGEADMLKISKLCRRIGLNVTTEIKDIDKNRRDKEKIVVESKRKIASMRADGKEKVRRELIETQAEGKAAACDVSIANITAKIKDRVRSADLDLASDMVIVNKEIHNVQYLVPRRVLFWRKLRRISLHGDVAIALTREGVITSSTVDLSKFSTNRQWSMIRGSHIATIFQDPMTSLNPLLSIGTQISEVLRIHHNLDRAAAKKEAIDLLKKVKIPEAEQRYNDYPFQYSGGMRQRVVIAIALACRPDILICDEPTTALDVTVQAQILSLIKDLQKEFGFTIIFITHDLGVVAGVADRIGVMYGGQIVEYGTDEDIFYRSAHPYTWALLSSLPQLAVEGEPLTYIRGNPPSFAQEIDGDSFAPRSVYAMQIDYIIEPPLTQMSDTHFAKTWLLDKRAPRVKKPALIRNLEERMKVTADHFLASSKGGDENA